MKISLVAPLRHNSDLIKHDINITNSDSFMQPASLKMFHDNLSGIVQIPARSRNYSF